MLEEDHKVEESSAVNNKEAFSVSLDAFSFEFCRYISYPLSIGSL